MAYMGNHSDPEIARLVTAFFNSGEKEYFLELMKDEEEKKLHEMLTRQKPHELFNKANEILRKIDSGLVTDEEMETYEYRLVHLLGALEEIEMIKILEKESDNNVNLFKGPEYNPLTWRDYAESMDKMLAYRLKNKTNNDNSSCEAFENNNPNHSANQEEEELCR